MKVLDWAGLTYGPTPPEYAELLLQEYQADQYVLEHDRLATLARLQHGAGVTVVTGPAGAAFWSLASPEVRVEVQPDGYEMTDRTADPFLWAARLHGVTPTQAKRWAGTDPRDWPKAGSAKRATLDAVTARVAQFTAAAAGQEALVLETFPVRVLREAEALAFLAGLDEYVALDWEWTRADRSPVGLAVSGAVDNVYIPVVGSDYQSPPDFGRQLQEAFGHVLRSRPCVLHNAKADIQTQYPGDPLELVGRPIDDTLVEAYLVGETTLGLKALTKKYLRRDAVSYPGELAALPVALAGRYAAAGDTRNTYDLHALLARRLVDQGQLPIYEQLERPLVPLLASVEQQGITVDAAVLQRLSQEAGGMEDTLRSMVLQREGLDLASDTETSQLFFRKLGFLPGKLKKEVISRLSFAPWVDTVMGYRKLRHRRTSFLAPYLRRWEAAGRPKKFQAYAQFNQAGAVDPNDPRGFKNAPRTGRLSSSGVQHWNTEREAWEKDGLNLQNQDREIRELFTAKDGQVIVSLDYVGLEMHIGADIYQDPVMLATLTRTCPEAEEDPEHRCGQCDLHSLLQETVAAMQDIEVDRPAAKQGNFCGQYGGGATMLRTIMAVQRIDLTEAQCEDVMSTRKTLYTGYEAGVTRLIEAAHRDGYTETVEGRRRYEVDLESPDWKTRSHAERALANHRIQGTAADILKRAMLNVVPALTFYGARIVAQVHDEIVFTVPEANADNFLLVATQAMEALPLPNGLALKVEGGYGASWASVH